MMYFYETVSNKPNIVFLETAKTWRRVFYGSTTPNMVQVVIIGHQPKQCTILRGIPQIDHRFAACLIPSKWVPFNDPYGNQIYICLVFT